MSNEVFHECRAAGVTFTQDEWSEYLRRCREDESQRIVTQIGRYDFNDCDVCLNPEVLTIASKTGSYGYSVTLKWAECRNGIWSYAVDYNCGTGGGGSGVHYADTLEGKSWLRGYPSEREAQQAACDEAIRQVRSARDGKSVLGDRLIAMVEDYRKTISRPKIVELSLF